MDRWQEDLLYTGELRRDLAALQNDTNITVEDRDIAADLLKDSKFSLSRLAVAIPETTHPELRQTLVNHFNECAREHFQIADFVSGKGWYNPYASPEKQLAQAWQDSRTVS